MPLTIPSPPHPLLIPAAPLTASTFSPFGTLITNPCTPSLALSANQGSALKYAPISPFQNLYAQAPSHVPGAALLNMFVCSPRTLEEGKREGEKVFNVRILERHPFTTQTFSPLGISPSCGYRYLIIVAPSLPLSELDIGLPVPRCAPSGTSLPGRGLPDLANLKAFLAKGDQAVTYAAGTWHAPMVVLGEGDVAFVVAQFGNGVEGEDCQEVVWEGGVGVLVPGEVVQGEGRGTEVVVTDRLGGEGRRAIHGEGEGDKLGGSKL